jgi:hypothetical protein
MWTAPRRSSICSRRPGPPRFQPIMRVIEMRCENLLCFPSFSRQRMEIVG